MLQKVKENIVDLIKYKILEAKDEGFEGVEIQLFMRAYDITDDVINELREEYDVIYAVDQEIPTLYISWEVKW